MSFYNSRLTTTCIFFKFAASASTYLSRMSHANYRMFECLLFANTCKVLISLDLRIFQVRWRGVVNHVFYTVV